jgi:hypothetical protein
VSGWRHLHASLHTITDPLYLSPIWTVIADRKDSTKLKCAVERFQASNSMSIQLCTQPAIAPQRHKWLCRIW